MIIMTATRLKEYYVFTFPVTSRYCYPYYHYTYIPWIEELCISSVILHHRENEKSNIKVYNLNKYLMYFKFHLSIVTACL